MTEESTESGKKIELSPEDAESLKKQAEFFRRHGGEAQEQFSEQALSGWKKSLYLFVVFFAIFSAVFLLIAQQTRRQLIASLGERWVGLYGEASPEIFKLPPPPPQAVRSKVVVPGLSPAVVPADQPSGVLFLDQQPFSSPEEEVPAAPVLPIKTEAYRKAYNLLAENSRPVRELVANAVPEFEFKDWQPVKDQAPEFWIGLLLMRRSDGQEVQMVWSINAESGRVVALSQAARDWLASRPPSEDERRRRR